MQKKTQTDLTICIYRKILFRECWFGKDAIEGETKVPIVLKKKCRSI